MIEAKNVLDLEIADNNPKRMKFVDYFNEWWLEKFGRVHGDEGFKYTMRFDNVHVLSHKMGFVFWLEYNGKLDTEKICDLQGFDGYSAYERIIMLLSIQDNPMTYILDLLK